MPVRIPFANTYARLPGRFFARLDPAPVAAPRLVRVNGGLTELLGLDPDVTKRLAAARPAAGSGPPPTHLCHGRGGRAP